EVTRGYLIDALLQTVFDASIGLVVGNSPMNRKYGSDAGIDVDVGGSVQRIKHQNILSFFGSRNRNDVFRFFRGHHAEVTVVSHGTANRLLRKLVEFLNMFTVNIDITGLAQNLHQTSLVYLSGDDLRSQSQARHECCKVAARAWMETFLVENMLLNCFDFAL